MNETLVKTLGIDVEKLESDLNEGWSFPSSWYSDPVHHEFERDNIFCKNWQYIGPRHKLQNPGDVVVGWAGNAPIVVTCGKDGELRGFINVCRHRGYTVAKKDGNCRSLVCGYHAWTYNLDGSLRGAPGIQDEPCFKKDQMGLVSVKVDEWGPAVFVSLDPEAKSFTTINPNFEGKANELGFPSDSAHYLKNYTLVREITYEFEANWKLWYDNNTECYHCPTIHSGSFTEAFNVDAEDFVEEKLDNMLIYSFPPSNKPVAPGALRSSEQHAIQVFPGFSIMRQDDIMTMLQAIPTGPETSRKILHFFAENDADASRVDRWINVWNQTFEEDQGAVQIQQTALRSGYMPQCRYMTNREGATVYVNRLTWNAYKQALGISS